MNLCLWMISRQKRGQIWKKKTICHLNFKVAQTPLFSKCTQWKATLWLASGLHFQITDLVGFKRLHLEETMNNFSYYIITEYLKPWESSKSYFSFVSPYSRVRSRAYFLDLHFKNQCWCHSVPQSSGTVPLWWRVPASRDLPSVARPAWRGGSCSDSGGRTLSPAGLEEHKGQRHKTSHTWNRITAMGDSSSWDKVCI